MARTMTEAAGNSTGPAAELMHDATLRRYFPLACSFSDGANPFAPFGHFSGQLTM